MPFEPTPALVIDLVELFQKQFGSRPYQIPGASAGTQTGERYKLNLEPQFKSGDKDTAKNGAILKEKYLGVEIFLPIRLFDNKDLLMYLPYCVVSITGRNTYIKTPMIERSGTVKELYSEDDWQINIKGFVIGQDRKFPEDELGLLKECKKKKKELILDNALTNIFLINPSLQPDEQCRVVIDDVSFPEVQGGREHVRPFTMKLTSDTIFTLELEQQDKVIDTTA